MTTTNGNALAVREEKSAALGMTGGVQINGLRDVFALAERLAQAEGFVPRHLLGKPNAIAASILTGIELGMGPMEAMRSIDIVEGKPTLKAEVMLARAIRAGIVVEWERTDDKIATIKLERGRAKHRHSFTIEEAQRAGLAGRGNWSKYAPAMLRARCISAAMRAFCPDVLGASVYAEGELDASDNVIAEPRAAEPVRMPPAESIGAAVEAARHVETEDGEIVEVRQTFADCRDPVELHAFCRDKRSALEALKNGQRETAIAKAKAAAKACGADEAEVLAWCGLGVAP
jgi:hypothetical protein